MAFCDRGSSTLRYRIQHFRLCWHVFGFVWGCFAFIIGILRGNREGMWPLWSRAGEGGSSIARSLVSFDILPRSKPLSCLPSDNLTHIFNQSRHQKKHRTRLLFWCHAKIRKMSRQRNRLLLIQLWLEAWTAAIGGRFDRTVGGVGGGVRILIIVGGERPTVRHWGRWYILMLQTLKKSK